MARVLGKVFSVVLLFGLLTTLLSGCRDDNKSAAPPAIYLLNYKFWTPILVLNFTEALAPTTDNGQALVDFLPQIEPSIAGEWHWQDPSRLVFYPSDRTFTPDSNLKISLQDLKLRNGYSLEQTRLQYHTPALQVTKQACQWLDSEDAPLRRTLEFILDFNYPVVDATLSAALENGSDIALYVNKGTHLTVSSDPQVRPAQDTTIHATFKDEKLHVMARKPGSKVPGANNYFVFNDDDLQASLEASNEVSLNNPPDCQLKLVSSDWDKFDADNKAIPTVKSIALSLDEGKISVNLQGKALSESATKANAGAEVKSGIALTPAVAGTWHYGEAAAGGDLIFTPTSADGLQPGISYKVSVDAEVFPACVFEQKQPSNTLKIPAMQAEVGNLQLYTDPQDPKIKRATATLNFNYPPGRDILNAKTAVWSRQLPAKKFSDAVGYEISYDEKDPKLAYLKTTPIPIKEAPSEIKLVLDKGIVAAAGGAGTENETTRILSIPSARDYLKVTEMSVQSIIKADDSLERLLILRTSVALQDPASLEQAVSLYLLPDCRIKNPARPAFCAQKDLTEWQTANQVDAEVLKQATSIPLKWQDADNEDKTVQHLTFTAPENQQVLIIVKQGLKSLDGFSLHQDARFLEEIGANQRELKILHEGALLSLSGNKKLGVTARGVNNVHVELQRVLPHNMHHVVHFTEGNFENPSFNLPIEHFAEKFEYDEALPSDKDMQRHYFAVDFARFTRTQGFPPRGLFILKVSEKLPDTCKDNPEPEVSSDDAQYSGNTDGTETSADAETDNADTPIDDENQQAADNQAPDECTVNTSPDTRLVLLTDMGLLVKSAANGQQEVFAMSFRTGLPVADAQISLLGKNGVALFSGKTDNLGHVSFPTTEGLKAEKTPTVYLAEKAGDLSFLPFNRDNRQLDFARFDTDGLRDQADTLQAYLFSDRGIYRPGDNVHIGLLLRKRDWSALPAGLPLKVVISDPENQEVWSHTLSFGAEGFEEINWTSLDAGKTGTYRVELIMADKSKKSLGSTRIRVEEFQPDHLQVKTDIPTAPATGWLSPTAAKARVSVRNLFGTPAAGNVTKLELTFRPWQGLVPGYNDYRFRRTLPDKIPDLPQALGEAKTDAQGEASYDLPLAAISEPVYEITLAGEGFEKDAGRSVVSMTTALVSRQAYLLGYGADGSLDFIPKDTPRNLHLLALGADFKPRAIETLSAEIIENRYVSTLVQRQDGLYQYQSVQRQQALETRQLTLNNGKLDFTLPSTNPGQFLVVFKNAQGEELNRVDYSVAGSGNVTRNIEHNAELNLHLSKKEYEAGETIDVEIVAPYQGAGLISVEQDGLLSSQWFKTTTTASTQHITLPKNISGNAYLSVAFVRAMDSKEIFMSPLSYGVVPFSISRQRFTQDVSLKVPETVQPGTNLEVHYQVKEATKLVVYAVDEGILQFAHYNNPTPLDYFFRKRALQVRTHQILDMILPDFALVQNLSLPGGDEDKLLGKYKNPFARKHKAPMAFWSGIIDAQPGDHSLQIPVPDYFNGSIRVLAVSANAGKLAVPVTHTVASQAYVIQPQQPWVAAPGDEFDMGVLVANTSGVPGAQALQVSVNAGEALDIKSAPSQTLTLAPGQDGTVRFHARANEKLGAVNVHYQVTGGGKSADYNEEMSIRPAQPLLTTLQAGVLTAQQQSKGDSLNLSQKRQLYNEQRQTELSVSVTPAAYLRGIIEYLKNYPYGCTEQITSQAFPAVVLGNNAELGLSTHDVEKLLERSVHILQTRQKHDGSFGYWTAADDGIPFYSMYATHLLLEARERGQKVPEAMLSRALQYADTYSQDQYYDSYALEAQAYAFYLLARNGVNVAERLRAFEAQLQAEQKTSGTQTDNRVNFLLGAAYQLHHLDQDANRLLAGIQKQWQTSGQLPASLQNNPEDLSLYLYLVGKHLPALIDTQDPKFGNYLLALSQDLIKQRMNSFRGSLSLLGMGNLWTRFSQEQQQSFTIMAGTPLAQLELHGNTIKTVALLANQQPLQLQGKSNLNLYYQLSETGYDLAAPSKAIAEKITINRDLLNDKGEKVSSIGLQDNLHIRIALHPDKAMKDVAVVMLIPGGFEIDLSEQGLANRKSLPIDKKPLWEPDYIDVQEDRLVLFGALDGSEKYFEFRLKPLNSGSYQVPPVFAEGMYDTEIQYRGMADKIQVTNDK
ncbi:alpha-2-macroglobulin [Methylomonas sp. AM2-LC]|uniref:alpha-2-macroglobulin family protein n=1 Tax=Methylomonas sp. AM2-LC TaxID=3153301 RepID=UPI003265A256